jgi:putative transposase
MLKDDQRRPFSPRTLHRLPEERYSQQGSAFLITIRARYGTRPFAVPQRAKIVVEALADQRQKVGCWVGAYCVMPDHAHFVCGPDREGASVKLLADRVKGASTNASWRTGWDGVLWQQRFHDSELEEADAVNAACEYVLNNPVRAGLVEAPEDWGWGGVMDELP